MKSEDEVSLGVVAVIAGMQAQQSAMADDLIQRLMVDSMRLRVLEYAMQEHAADMDSKKEEAKLRAEVWKVMKMSEGMLEAYDERRKSNYWGN